MQFSPVNRNLNTGPFGAYPHWNSQSRDICKELFSHVHICLYVGDEEKKGGEGTVGRPHGEREEGEEVRGGI